MSVSESIGGESRQIEAQTFRRKDCQESPFIGNMFDFDELEEKEVKEEQSMSTSTSLEAKAAAPPEKKKEIGNAAKQSNALPQAVEAEKSSHSAAPVEIEKEIGNAAKQSNALPQAVNPMLCRKLSRLKSQVNQQHRWRKR
ncbi:unnamed protein product [Durusdinium trenchii]|uniref:Uncharacterized protein n=1 Tax=Durusdinium trenchii TaxID=1381693 RepID=A0ABP0RXC3_9DINO